MSGDNFPPNTSDRAAGPNWSGYMQRWAAGTSTIASFAFSGTGAQRRLYVPLATASAAGAISAAQFSTLALALDPPRCQLTRTTNQSIANGTITAVSWNNAYVNTGGAGGAAMWSAGTNPTRITAPVDGFYEVTASLTWASAAGNIRHAWLAANGDTFRFAASEMAPTAGGNTTRQVAAGIIFLTAGSYIEYLGYQDSGAALNVVTSTALPYLAMKWVSPT